MKVILQLEIDLTFIQSTLTMIIFKMCVPIVGTSKSHKVALLIPWKFCVDGVNNFALLFLESITNKILIKFHWQELLTMKIEVFLFIELKGIIL